MRNAATKLWWIRAKLVFGTALGLSDRHAWCTSYLLEFIGCSGEANTLRKIRQWHVQAQRNPDLAVAHTSTTNLQFGYRATGRSNRALALIATVKSSSARDDIVAAAASLKDQTMKSVLKKGHRDSSFLLLLKNNAN